MKTNPSKKMENIVLDFEKFDSGILEDISMSYDGDKYSGYSSIKNEKADLLFREITYEKNLFRKLKNNLVSDNLAMFSVSILPLLTSYEHTDFGVFSIPYNGKKVKTDFEGKVVSIQRDENKLSFEIKILKKQKKLME